MARPRRANQVMPMVLEAALVEEAVPGQVTAGQATAGQATGVPGPVMLEVPVRLAVTPETLPEMLPVSQTRRPDGG